MHFALCFYKSVRFAGVFLATECTFFYTCVGVGRTDLSLLRTVLQPSAKVCQHSALSSISS